MVLKMTMNRQKSLRHAVVVAVALLCIAVLPAAVSAEATYAWYGDGSSSEFIISDVGDLIGFANIVNGADGKTKDTFAGKTVRLAADIDLTGVTWTPIGSSMYDCSPTDDEVKMFEGTFDGCGHTIKGLSDARYIPLVEDAGLHHLNDEEEYSREYSFGLFGYVYGANISNVNLTNVRIDACTRTVHHENNDISVTGSGVAALVGYYLPKNEVVSVIENCHVLSGTVKASNNMGGLIGYMDSQLTQPMADITIIGCSNAAAVTTEAREAGGILGLMNSAREGNNYVTMRGTITFKDCINTGDITSLGGGAPSAGGILGRDHNQAAGQRLKLIFDGCKNSGIITVTANGETHAAGIASGYYSNGAWLIAKNCENTGNVVVNNPSNTVYAGGLISYGGVVELIDSTSTGTVTGGIGNTYVGGAQNILFLEGMDDLTDTVNGYTYYLNGGTSPEYAALVDDASGGGNFHLVETAYKDGYVFGGWYGSPECTVDGYVSPNTPLWKDDENKKKVRNCPERLYAKWGAANVTFNANGGSGVMTPITGQSLPFSLPQNTFTRAGYEFINWNSESDGTGISYDNQAIIDSSVNNLILYAQWKGAITFNANGGTGNMNPQEIQIHQPVTLTSNTFEYDGYSFAGWNTKPYGTGTFYADSTTFSPVENMNLYAQWKGAITFDANGGTGEMKPHVILRGHTEDLPPNTFTRTGYIFNNWNTKADGTGIPYYDRIPSAENMVLYVNWTVCNAHIFTNKVAEPEYLKSPATYTQKAVYYKSCTECGASSEGADGEATFEHGDVLEKVPETSSQGGSSSSGTYITMIRDAPEEGGEVLFKNSASMVESVTVPAGIVEGKIVVSAVTDADAPEGKDVEELFEVSIIGSYPIGEETIIMVTLPISELTKRGLTEADACLYHFDGEKWTKLFTTYEVNGDSIIYRGITESFSPFALVYEIGGAVPVEEEKPVDEPTEEPTDDVPAEVLPPTVDTPTENPETPMPMLGILAGIGCAAVFIRRK